MPFGSAIPLELTHSHTDARKKFTVKKDVRVCVYVPPLDERLKEKEKSVNRYWSAAVARSWWLQSVGGTVTRVDGNRWPEDGIR